MNITHCAENKRFAICWASFQVDWYSLLIVEKNNRIFFYISIPQKNEPSLFILHSSNFVVVTKHSKDMIKHITRVRFNGEKWYFENHAATKNFDIVIELF